MKYPIFLAGALAASLPSAAAQSFNLDLGRFDAFSGNGSAQSTYGGAAGQPGTWQSIDAAPGEGQTTFTSAALADVDNNATAATAVFTVQPANVDRFSAIDYDEPFARGNNALLMEDGLYAVGAPFEVRLQGLQGGDYEVYTYGLSPDLPTALTEIDVETSAEGPLISGGAFPATGHVQGISFTRHTVTLAQGSDLVINVASPSTVPASLHQPTLNGIQLRFCPSPIGTNYCDSGPTAAVPNSTGLPGHIEAFGSTSISAANVLLVATQLPDGEFCYFFTANGQTFSPNPNGSSGNLCVNGTSLVRYLGPGQLGSVSNGMFELQLPFDEAPLDSVAPGDTQYFQLWHRDMNSGGVTNNFTDAIEITFD